MAINHSAEIIIDVRSVSHCYGKVRALENASLKITKGSTVGLIGPDGVGKSTLLSLISGVKKIQEGEIFVFGQSIATQKIRDETSHRVAFMPQGLGRNLYFSLSIYENIDFVARLFGINGQAKDKKIEQLLRSTGLYEFKDRPAGQLSGGMKQKLGLCCALVHDPDILILDEPTTGVDPLSRKQFWILIDKLRDLNPNMAVIVATAYMEEAEQFEHQLGMFAGKLIFDDKLENLLAKSGTNSIEEAFVYYLPEDVQEDEKLVITPFDPMPNEPPVIVAENLTKKFGDFTAVDNVNFSIEKGEIFGFLGSNGCGKTTTMKMLTGLIEITSGSANLLGQPVNATDTSTKMKIGYMSQLFSLYNELTVKENLVLHGQLYQMDYDKIPDIVQESMQRFELVDVADARPSELSLGVQQRLQLAAACLHRPEVLILDEPTSGVDPVARDMFWKYLMHLSRDQRITIFVSTHFMNEAARCDRISFMDAGKVLAMDTPDEIVRQIGADNLEDAFIQYLLKANNQKSVEDTVQIDTEDMAEVIGESDTKYKQEKSISQDIIHWFNLTLTFARREMKEILRDKVRVVFTFVGPLMLLLCTVFCISFDIEDVRFSVLDEDNSNLGYDLIQHFDGSRYFNQISAIHSADEIESEIKRRDVDLIINIPRNYGKDLLNDDKPRLNFFIDGAQPFKASSAKQYISGIMLGYSSDWMKKQDPTQSLAIPKILEPRFLYNPEFKTIYSIVPGVIMLSLIIFTTMLTALGIVREKEKGSIINFYSSPARVTQYLIGKQLPYVVLTFLSGISLIVFSVFVVEVPYKGSLVALLFGMVLYLFAVSGLGLLISSIVKGEITAMFLAAILTAIPGNSFAGLIFPVSTLTGIGYWIAMFFPGSWFQKVSVGVFNKGLGFTDLFYQYWALFGFGVGFILIASIMLKKQEK